MRERSPYRNNYFCPECRMYIRKSRAHRGARGQPLCPNVHMRRQLRTRPHNNEARKT